MTALKLFVVNESDGSDPDAWGPWRDVFLVLAESANQAVDLVGDSARGEAAEVVFDRFYGCELKDEYHATAESNLRLADNEVAASTASLFDVLKHEDAA